MARYTKKKKEDIGLSPYALVFRGQKKTDKVELNLIEYNQQEVTEKSIKSATDLSDAQKSKNLCWINVNGLHGTEEMGDIASIFNIPVNIMSDIMNPDIRSKIEEFENGLLITLKTFQYNQGTEHLNSENFSLIILQNTLISFQERPVEIFNPIKERIRKFNNKIRTGGSDYLAFALIDVIIDNYIYIMGSIGDKIELLEQNLFNDDEIDKNTLKTINSYKQELSYFRRHAKPTKEMILNLAKLDSDFLHEENNIHFRELMDNIKEANEISDSYREMLFDLMNVYHMTLSTKLNDIMYVLTIFSVIFIPLTFIVGVYGTNFEFFPELKWKYSYFVMWGIMIVVSIGMVLYFKRRKWF